MDKSFCSSLCFLLLLKQNRIFAGTGIDIFNYTKGEKHFYFTAGEDRAAGLVNKIFGMETVEKANLLGV